jgi:AcrR family transcriptional regulator
MDGRRNRATHGMNEANQSMVKAGQRKLDPERTRRDILAAAREEFADRGLSGARMDAIAARTKTVKHMLYHYFGSKEGLYLAVLEAAYADIRHFESELNLDRYPANEALCRLIEFTFDYDEAHPDFIRLVCSENMHHAKHMAQSTVIHDMNRSVISILQRVLQRGIADGIFRPDLDPVDVHLMISSFCFFRVANRYTFSELFGRDLIDPASRLRHRQMLIDSVLHAVTITHKKASAVARA